MTPLAPLGRSTRQPEPGDLLLVGCVRDELLRLPCFLQYHRTLGVDRFLIIDNDSHDGTPDYLRSQGDVLVFSTTESYGESNCGVAWINEVLNLHAVGHWALILDTDELFVFPGCEYRDLRSLVSFLEGEDADAVVAPLLDMYSEYPIRKTAYEPGQPLLDVCPYFDADSYEYCTPESFYGDVIMRGGPRERLFWRGCDRPHPPPFLPKIPFVKWRQGLAYEASTHIIPRVRPSRRLTGALLHFKLLWDFGDRVALEADRKEHFANARQYASYADVMLQDPELTAHYEGSVRYRDSMQLVELGLMGMPPGFLDE